MSPAPNAPAGLEVHSNMLPIAGSFDEEQRGAYMPAPAKHIRPTLLQIEELVRIQQCVAEIGERLAIRVQGTT